MHTLSKVSMIVQMSRNSQYATYPDLNIQYQVLLRYPVVIADLYCITWTRVGQLLNIQFEYYYASLLYSYFA